MCRLFLIAVLTALGSFISSCGAGDSERTDSTPSWNIITIDGSSTVFPITEAVAEEFQKVHSHARVTVGISGTGGGFQKFCRGEVDITGASRPIKPSEIEACGNNGIEWTEIPVAYDGIVIVVNPENDWTNSMTVAELSILWAPDAQDQVLHWNQIRTGWPQEEIHLFGPGVDSGTFDYFTEVIAGEVGASRGDFTSSENDNVLVQGVSRDKLALGYFGYAYYEENQDKLKLLGVHPTDTEDDFDPIYPSPDTIREGTYRPLSRPIFIYVSKAAANRNEVDTFIKFYLNESTDLVREVGYVPLQESEYALARERYQQR